MDRYKYSLKFVQIILICVLIIGITTIVLEKQTQEELQKREKMLKVAEQMEQAMAHTKTPDSNPQEQQNPQEQDFNYQDSNQQDYPQEYQEQPQQQDPYQQISYQQDSNGNQQNEPVVHYTPPQASVEQPEDKVEILRQDAMLKQGQGDFIAALHIYKDIYKETRLKEDLMTIGELSMVADRKESLAELIDKHLRKNPQDAQDLQKYRDFANSEY